jgi:hypothetical protein
MELWPSLCYRSSRPSRSKYLLDPCKNDKIIPICGCRKRQVFYKVTGAICRRYGVRYDLNCRLWAPKISRGRTQSIPSARYWKRPDILHFRTCSLHSKTPILRSHHHARKEILRTQPYLNAVALRDLKTCWARPDQYPCPAIFVNLAMTLDPHSRVSESETFTVTPCAHSG